MAERFPIDDWAGNVTELSGGEIVSDPVEDLVVNSRRKRIVTDQEATRLYWDYLQGKLP